jgi:hypothetical protein
MVLTALALPAPNGIWLLNFEGAMVGFCVTGFEVVVDDVVDKVGDKVGDTVGTTVGTVVAKSATCKATTLPKISP